MLIGQEITIGYAILISIIGISVVMVELGLLSIFVRVMSKVISGANAKEEAAKAAAKAAAAPVAAAPVAQPVVAAPVSGDDDEIAAVMTAVLEESGLSPEEAVFVSITAL